MKQSRWMALLLAAVMVLSLFAAPAWAAEPEADVPEDAVSAVSETPEYSAEPDGWEESLYRVAPGYEMTQEELDAAQEELDCVSLEPQSSTKTVTSIKAAGKYLRGQMKKRKKKVAVVIKSKKLYSGDLWNQAYDEAVKHTGVPTEGDYINANILSTVGKIKGKYANKKYTYTLVYNLHYAASAAQEKKMDTAVKNLLTKLNLKKDSKFVKFHKLYNYMCDNIKYDDAGLARNDDGCHSAYAALVKKKAVCQGYASLLYRLCLECGIPARYISGYSSGENHGWNIVKLGGAYYNVDATWDATLWQNGQYFQYFLRSDATFKDHTRRSEYNTSAFNKKHPMSKKDGAYHYWEETVLQEPTCTEEGLKYSVCSDCGETKGTETIPALDHDWQWDYDNAEVVSEDVFRIQMYCARCGEQDPAWYYFDKEYNFLYAQDDGLREQSAEGPDVEALAAEVKAHGWKKAA